MAKETIAGPTKITVDDAWGRFDRGEPVTFVDTRNPQAWQNSNVKLPGALRVPADEIDRHLSEIPRDRPVVTYCT